MEPSFQSWGRLQRQTGTVVQAGKGAGFDLPESSFLAVGLGRSYGDVCLNSAGRVVRMDQRDAILAADWEQGLLHAEAGCNLGTLAETCLRHGWFPPVLPGTRHVTIGGAIANDVHGKNHHRAGSFGNHVRRLRIARSDRQEITDCSPGNESDLFHATVGGLGLTGVILSAELQLKPVAGPFVDVEFIPFDDLEAFARHSGESDAGWEYTVAWVDLIRATEKRLPGIFMRGNHSGHAPPSPSKPPRAWFRWPLTMPFCPFNRLTCGAFNGLYHWRQSLRREPFRQHYGAFFHPLDVIDDWNRLYGPGGFFQYQCVIPTAAGLDPFRDIFRELQRHRAAIPLAVLKQTGTLAPAGWLSFPMPGWTLAMDVPNKGSGTRQLFRILDHIVSTAGGRLYPAKDAAMGPSMFQAGYPGWGKLEALRDPLIQSDFWKRVTRPID